MYDPSGTGIQTTMSVLWQNDLVMVSKFRTNCMGEMLCAHFDNQNQTSDCADQNQTFDQPYVA